MANNVKDEFNDVKITNNRDLLTNEFSQNKNVEFYFTNTSNAIPSDEFSSKDNASIHSGNNENLQKTIEKAAESSTEATTVVSSATASGVTATSASVAVAASTVAVVAIGAAVGMTINAHKYDYQFNSFVVSANELTYELLIRDKDKEDDEEERLLSYDDFEEEKDKEESNKPLSLRVYNTSYDYTHDLYLGYNYNTFSNLILGETYNIVLSENRLGGQTLFKDKFTTFTNTKFKSFSIPGSANFLNNTFDVEMNYTDSNNVFSEFTLYLEDVEFPEELYATYQLKPESGTQQVDAINDYGENLDLYRTYNYKFSYKNNDETIDFDSGELSFEDIEGRHCKFNDLLIETYFASEEVVFTLDYVDDLNRYDNFVLTLDMVEDENQIQIELSPINTPQPKNVMEYDISFDYSYTYTLTANYLGSQKTIIEHTEPYFFTDATNGQSTFNGIVFIGGEAKFSNRSFNIKLEYQDDFSWLDEFVLEIDDLTNGKHLDIPLDTTTDEQPASANEMSVNEDTGEKEYVVDIVSHELEYNVRYSRRGETLYLYEEKQSLSFKNEEFLGIDTSSSGLVISGSAEDGYKLGMKFNFRENNDFYSQIYPVLYNQDGNVAEVIINSDVNHLEWNYFDVVAYGDTQLLTDLIGNEARLVINANIMDQANDYVCEDVVIYDQTIPLLASEDLEPEIYGVYMDEYVIGDSYEANMRSVLFTSTTSYFDDCQLVLTNLESGRTYSYDFDLEDGWISFNFNLPSSGTFDATEFEEDLSYPFKIELIYYIYVESQETGSSGPTMVKTGPNTFVCYESFQFILSV